MATSVDKVLDDTLDSLEDFIDQAGPKLAAGLSTFVQDSQTLFKQFPTRLTVTRLAPDLAGFDPKDYSILIDAAHSDVLKAEAAHSGRESEIGQQPLQRTDSFERLVVEYGAPVKIKWTAPLNHSKRDWIGLYRVGDNASREVTKVGSQGRWAAVTPGAHDYNKADQGILVADKKVSGTDGDILMGEIEFSSDKLWWTQGVFEFRYHHDGKYNVMATSLPFEIKISRVDDEALVTSHEGLARSAVEETLLPIVQNCFDRDPDVAPRSFDEQFGPTLEREGKYAKRVVYAVQQMFGIEFAPEVVQADGNVRNLAWRICNAKKVLAPYSMKTGTVTPQ